MKRGHVYALCSRCKRRLTGATSSGVPVKFEVCEGAFASWGFVVDAYPTDKGRRQIRRSGYRTEREARRALEGFARSRVHLSMRDKARAFEELLAMEPEVLAELLQESDA